MVTRMNIQLDEMTKYKENDIIEWIRNWQKWTIGILVIKGDIKNGFK